MKIIFFFCRNKTHGILFIILFIIKISFSSQDKYISTRNNILNLEYNHNSTDNLYFVFEHFRHGARSTCEGKIINNTDLLGGKWQDSGGLTKLGKKQHYIIGKKNRVRYRNFINNEYDPKEILIYSTDYIRTINSAQIQLSGLYNQLSFENISNNDIIGEEKININLNTIIPPVNLFEYKKEGKKGIFEVLYREKFTCPLFKNNIDKNKKKLYYFETMNKIRNNFNSKYFNILEKEYSLNDTDSHKGMYNFCDAFITNYFDEDNNKLKLMKLERKNHTFNLTHILNICYDYYKDYFFKIEGEKYAKINGILSMSKTLQKIINIMKNRIDNGNPKYISYESPKFLLYSGHDDTLSQMQLFLKACFNIEYEWVPFASTQLFELRKYKDIFYVEIYYNDRLKLNITFEEFQDEIQKNIYSEKDINKKCYSFKNSLYFDKIIWIIIIFVIFLIIYVSIRIYFYILKTHNN